MLGQQQQQLYSSAALLTGERSRLLTCYVQDYLECVESLPHDMQRNVSVLRELDNKYQGRGPRSCVCGPPLGRIRWPPGTVARRLPGEVPLSISPVTVSPSAQRGSGVWDGGEGLETAFGALPSPAAVGEDLCGVSRVGVGAARQPPLQTQRLQLVWKGISHFKQHLFRRLPARCRRPSCPGEGACSRAGGCRERAAGRSRTPAGLPGLALPLSSDPHPESRCIGTCGVGGEEGAGEGREGGLGEVPPSALRLPARELSSFPSPAPGKVPGRSLFL